MKKVTEIDKNFAVQKKVEVDNLVYYDIEDKPFKIYGVQKENGKFRRMPEEIANKVNEGVSVLHTHTAGGRVRFVTDSPYVVIHAELCNIEKFDHFPMTGVAGLDMYVRENGNERYCGTFRPPLELENGYESLLELDRGECIVTINMPLYSCITKLYIGLDENAILKEAPDYTYEKPVVYYGSSITQGGCASRPGNAYESILTRWLDCNHMNLGFSGSALGEEEMAGWIAKLDMKAFVMDYDYNAPTVKHLEQTHERMFQMIRQAQPELPIIMMSCPQFFLGEREQQRLQIIQKTYEHAVSAGDQNIYFISGPELMKEVRDEGTVDNCHPNDAGFYSMAKAIFPVLEQILLQK